MAERTVHVCRTCGYVWLGPLKDLAKHNLTKQHKTKLGRLAKKAKAGGYLMAK